MCLFISINNESEKQNSHKTEFVYLRVKHTHSLISGLKRNVHPMAAHIDNIDVLLPVRDVSLIVHTDCLTHES